MSDYYMRGKFSRYRTRKMGKLAHSEQHEPQWKFSVRHFIIRHCRIAGCKHGAAITRAGTRNHSITLPPSFFSPNHNQEWCLDNGRWFGRERVNAAVPQPSSSRSLLFNWLTRLWPMEIHWVSANSSSSSPSIVANDSQSTIIIYYNHIIIKISLLTSHMIHW